MQKEEARAGRLLERLPPDVRAALSEDQRQAILAAVAEEGWRDHAVDVGVSLPFFGGRGFYIRLVAGQERRNRTRVQMERRARRPWTWKNVAFLLGLTVGLGLLWAVLVQIARDLFARR